MEPVRCYDQNGIEEIAVRIQLLFRREDLYRITADFADFLLCFGAACDNRCDFHRRGFSLPDPAQIAFPHRAGADQCCSDHD